MAVLTPASQTYKVSHPGGFETKVLIIRTAACDSGDTLALVLATYGATAIWGIQGFVHTTTDSVIATEAPTTSVTTGTLTITVGGSSVTGKVRTYRVELYCG